MQHSLGQITLECHFRQWQRAQGDLVTTNDNWSNVKIEEEIFSN